MVNSKTIAIIVGISIVIIASISIGIQSEEITIKNSSPSTEVDVSDLAVVEKNDQNYIIDEQGNKKYVISVGDSPMLGD